MATVPTSEDIKIISKNTIDEIDQKIVEQGLEGKSFIVPEDGHHAGVIPEDIWEKYKVEV